jgi:hypothetical protein
LTHFFLSGHQTSQLRAQSLSSRPSCPSLPIWPATFRRPLKIHSQKFGCDTSCRLHIHANYTAQSCPCKHGRDVHLL